MKKILKRIMMLLLCTLAVIGAVAIVPDSLLASQSAMWVSERFSETLKEKNELVVYEVQLEAQETVSQDAWLIGTVQKVVIPYTFAVRYVIDLNAASVYADEGKVILSLPRPMAKYQQLMVDEKNIVKSDWLYPLTTDRYAEMVYELEEKLMSEYSTHPEYLNSAWEMAVTQLQKLFTSVLNPLTDKCELLVIPQQD